MDREAVSARLLALFVEELDEHVQGMNTDLLALEASPGDAERLRSLFRALHTLKGAARAVSLPEIEDACHAAEELLAAARDAQRSLDTQGIQLLFSTADALADAGVRLREGRSLIDAPVAGIPARLAHGTAGPGRLAPETGVREPSPAPDRPEPAPPRAELPRPGPPVAEPASVRVSPERLDELLASAGELLALARRASSRAAQLRALEEFVAGWTAEWQQETIRLGRTRGAAGAPAERPDSGVATGEQLRQLAERVGRLARDAAGDSRHLGRGAESLIEQVRRLRMRPVQEALESLPRTVRDLATSAGKEVRLLVEGDSVEVDRGVLDSLREAVLAVVRNAVDHGLEPPEERERAGKPAQGTLRVDAELVGDRVVVTVADDGRGLDAARIRARLAEAGAPAPEDDSQLGQILLAGGVSSRSSVTRISGRGVGLDIVRAAMERVRGSVSLQWEAGRGTQVRLEFPPSLASLRALLVGVGSEVLAVPTLAVQSLVRVPVAALRSVEGRPVLSTPDGPVPLASLARVLGPPLVERPLSGVARVVVLASRSGRAALLVDELLTEEELVLHPLYTGRVALPLIAGAATLASGGVAPLLDAPAVVAAAQAITAGIETPRDARRQLSPRILVADDSLTTRALEQSLLEAAGYTVLTAADGLDAWRVLQEETVDLLVSDVEMPRADGFRLCEMVRAAARLRQLPVVLVTARESAEDRARGLEAGADAYLPKSSFDQEQLLDTIRQLLD